MLLYASFSILAILVNIGMQDVMVSIYFGPMYLWVSMIAGTGMGLIVKYILDKKFIFKFRAYNLKKDSYTFILYSIMGVLTTAIFWGFEFLFHVFFNGERNMRYLGAVIGLTLGYIVKYHLDKKYVFNRKNI